MNFAGYDQWKTTEPDDPDTGVVPAVACLDCGWVGRGGATAYAHHHHLGAHHRIALRAHPDQQLRFSCCAGGANVRTHLPQPAR